MADGFPPHPERRPAFVTGASSGIGAAIAAALAGAGFPVALGARRVDRLEELASRINETGGQAVAVPVDVTDDNSVLSALESARESIGDIEVLVSNAGTLIPAEPDSPDTNSFFAQIDLNLGGAQRMVSGVLAAMIARQRGDIVLVSSENSIHPRPLVGAYNAAKAGLESYGRTLQMELEGTGVRASIVRPGPTQTELGWDWDPEVIDRTLGEWKRWGLLRHFTFLGADSIARAVLEVVCAPRGTHLSLVEVNPEAPIRKRIETDKADVPSEQGQGGKN